MDGDIAPLAAWPSRRRDRRRPGRRRSPRLRRPGPGRPGPLRRRRRRPRRLDRHPRQGLRRRRRLRRRPRAPARPPRQPRPDLHLHHRPAPAGRRRRRRRPGADAGPEGDRRRALLPTATSARRRPGQPRPRRPAPPRPHLPVVLGIDARALAAPPLRARGFFVPAIRPPTVPRARPPPPHPVGWPPPDDLERSRPPCRGLRDDEPRSAASSSPAPTPASARPWSPPASSLARRPGLVPIPFKPVETGCDPDPVDARRLWRAAAPPSPPTTSACTRSAPRGARPGRRRGRAADRRRRHRRRARRARRPRRLLLVEGAGGLLVPYAGGADRRRPAARSACPSCRRPHALGTINHTALTLAEAPPRLPVAGCIRAAPTPDGPHEAATPTLITAVTGRRPLAIVPFLPADPPMIDDRSPTPSATRSASRPALGCSPTSLGAVGGARAASSGRSRPGGTSLHLPTRSSRRDDPSA